MGLRVHRRVILHKGTCSFGYTTRRTIISQPEPVPTREKKEITHPHDPASQSPPKKYLSHLHLLPTPRPASPRAIGPPHAAMCRRATPIPLCAHHHADVCRPQGRGEAEQSHGWLEHVLPLWPAVDHDQALAGRKELGQGSSWALDGGVALGGGEALSLR